MEKARSLFRKFIGRRSSPAPWSPIPSRPVYHKEGICSTPGLLPSTEELGNESIKGRSTFDFMRIFPHPLGIATIANSKCLVRIIKPLGRKPGNNNGPTHGSVAFSVVPSPPKQGQYLTMLINRQQYLTLIEQVLPIPPILTFIIHMDPTPNSYIVVELGPDAHPYLARVCDDAEVNTHGSEFILAGSWEYDTAASNPVGQYVIFSHGRRPRPVRVQIEERLGSLDTTVTSDGIDPPVARQDTKEDEDDFDSDSLGSVGCTTPSVEEAELYELSTRLPSTPGHPALIIAQKSEGNIPSATDRSPSRLSDTTKVEGDPIFALKNEAFIFKPNPFETLTPPDLNLTYTQPLPSSSDLDTRGISQAQQLPIPGDLAPVPENPCRRYSDNQVFERTERVSRAQPRFPGVLLDSVIDTVTRHSSVLANTPPCILQEFTFRFSPYEIGCTDLTEKSNLPAVLLPGPSPVDDSDALAPGSLDTLDWYFNRPSQSRGFDSLGSGVGESRWSTYSSRPSSMYPINGSSDFNAIPVVRPPNSAPLGTALVPTHLGNVAPSPSPQFGAFRGTTNFTFAVPNSIPLPNSPLNNGRRGLEIMSPQPRRIVEPLSREAADYPLF